MSLTDADLELLQKYFPWYRGKTVAQIVAEREAMKAKRKAEREDPLYRSGLSAGRLAKEKAIVQQWEENYNAWRVAGNKPGGPAVVDDVVQRRRKLTAKRVRRHRANKTKQKAGL